MKIGLAMGAEQTASLIKELQECLARDAKSVLLYTTDEPEVIQIMEELHRSTTVPSTSAIPSPDVIHIGAIWPLAFDDDLVMKVEEEYRQGLN